MRLINSYKDDILAAQDEDVNVTKLKLPKQPEPELIVFEEQRPDKEFEWTKGQLEAIDRLLTFLDNPEQKEFLLQGRAGTGKTTVIKEVFNRYKQQGKYISVIGVAIAHAAKKVLQNSIPNSHTFASAAGLKMTVSRFGEIDFVPDYMSDLEPPIEKAKCVVFDEASMLSAKNRKTLHQACRPNAKIIYIADIHQLPPVTKDKQSISPIFKEKMPSATLVENKRSGEDNPITDRINNFADAIDIILDKNDVNAARMHIAKPDTRYNASGVGYRYVDELDEFVDWFYTRYLENPTDPRNVKIATYRNATRSNINNMIRRKIYGEQVEYEQFCDGEMLVAMDSYRPSNKTTAGPLFYNSEYFILESYRRSRMPFMSLDPEEILEGKMFNIQVLWLKLKGLNQEVPVVAEESFKDYQYYLNTLKTRALNNRYLWREFFDFKNTFAPLDYGYAVTAYKSQGDTYNYCGVHELDIRAVRSIDTLTRLQSMYTAASRPTKELVIYNGTRL